MPVNERIRSLIKALKIKQAEFAQRIGVSRPFVSELCSGAKNPSDRTIADICREFGVNEHWLRTGEGDMFVNPSREEEVMRFAATVIRNPSSEFQRQALSLLAKLTPEQWQLMEQMARKLLQEQAKESPQPEESPTDAK
ncbi:MAG: helix-turn-helix domain-containing protein [Oscillospiraceae bacterium]|jgi:bacteriophage CI repressor helix-turn-helix domain|uniref:Helix-turn-helix domain protein n=1 Tax=Siphoviridae sp. ctWBz6 TaxID=2825536 RepID=A0A8S5QG40_9CAUD|nr:MAG TPA: helix-turn-helix domain protein [Siphoviridae sp. ctWBz6]